MTEKVEKNAERERESTINDYTNSQERGKRCGIIYGFKVRVNVNVTAV